MSITNKEVALFRKAVSTMAGLSSSWKPNPRRRALAEHLPAEPKQLGRPTPSRGIGEAGPLYQSAPLDQATKIWLVQSDTGQRLYDLLELVESEGARKKLKNDRSIGQLASKARQAGGHFIRPGGSREDRHRWCAARIALDWASGIAAAPGLLVVFFG